MSSYNPIDDTKILESKDGMVEFEFGGKKIQFFDLLVPGNRMIFESRLYRIKDKGIKSVRLDLSIDENNKRHLGSGPISLDSDSLTWGFKSPYEEKPGIYRRNAYGWIIQGIEKNSEQGDKD